MYRQWYVSELEYELGKHEDKESREAKIIDVYDLFWGGNLLLIHRNSDE